MATSTGRSTTESALVVATADGLHLPNRAEPLLRGRRIGSIAVDHDRVWDLVDSVELYRSRLGAPRWPGAGELRCLFQR
jgi:hypothetical protein